MTDNFGIIFKQPDLPLSLSLCSLSTLLCSLSLSLISLSPLSMPSIRLINMRTLANKRSISSIGFDEKHNKWQMDIFGAGACQVCLKGFQPFKTINSISVASCCCCCLLLPVDKVADINNWRGRLDEGQLKQVKPNSL